MAVVIVNPNSTSAMTDAMVSVARTAAPGLEFDGWTSHEGPPAIQGREDGAAATQPLLELAGKADASAASGLVIGCFDDTALAEVTEQVTCPVVGIGQAAFIYSALRRWRFSVVTSLSVSVPIVEENIENYGLSLLVGRVRASGVPVLDLEDAPERSAEQILGEAQAALADDGIDAIVLGCAGMVRISSFLRANLPCPVIDPVEAAAGCMALLTASKATDGAAKRRLR